MSLLQAYPPLQTQRFIHGILSTESGPSIHFMSVYGFAGADVHQEAQQKNDQLFQAVFDYAACFGNAPVYIGMDANTDTLSSRSISRPCLSRRWTVCPTCFTKRTIFFSGSLNGTHFGGASNLMQMYDNFVGFALLIVLHYCLGSFHIS